jgi:predicted O-methyltransferase YrrM
MKNWIEAEDYMQPCLNIPDLDKTLERIRAKSAELGHASWTSIEYQDDVISSILRTASHPGPVVEVGLFHGGLSVQIAYVCNHIEKDYFAIDISSECIDITQKHLEALNIDKERTVFFTGTLEAFAKIYLLNIPPAVIIIDAFHIYTAVRNDLAACLTYFPNAVLVVMHDYALTYNPSYVVQKRNLGYFSDVKNPIHHIIGNNAPMLRMGYTGNGEPAIYRKYDTSDLVNAAIFREGEPEGVGILLELLMPDAFLRAFIYYHLGGTAQASAVVINGVIADGGAEQRSGMPPLCEFKKFEPTKLWQDFFIDFAPVFDMSDKWLQVYCVNEGSLVSIRLALISETEEHVFESQLQFSSGNSIKRIRASTMGILRGKPNITRISKLLLGGVIDNSGLYVLVSIVDSHGKQTYQTDSTKK